jgi:hypothetical protein
MQCSRFAGKRKVEGKLDCFVGGATATTYNTTASASEVKSK